MAESIISAVLRWLHAGYPEGVPPKDRFPLLALLRRTLSEADFAEITEQLAAEPPPILVEDIRQVIERVTAEPPEEADVRQVAARLAESGWPLSGGVLRLADEAEKAGEAARSSEAAAGEAANASDSDATQDAEAPVADRSPEVTEAGEPEESRPNIVERVIAWLRVGYPEGVPTTDYIPLLALLRRRLTDDEVAGVAEVLIKQADEDGEVSSIDARVLMSKVLNDLPSEEDLDRVREHLTDIGGTLT